MHINLLILGRETRKGGKEEILGVEKDQEGGCRSSPQPGGSRVSHSALSGDQNKWIHPHNLLLAQPLTGLCVAVFHAEKR